MPTRGLSLVGFMGQQQAIDHFKRACVPQSANPTDAALIADWQHATNQLGPSFGNAGTPNIQPMPQNAHTQQMQADPWTAAALQGIPGGSLQLVEIDPLLAFQFFIDLDRSQHHCGQLAGPPNIDELFPVCLPIGEPAEPFQLSVNPQATALIVKSRSLNLRNLNTQLTATPAAVHLTFQFGFPPPFVQVVRLGRQCFLFNGYHRVYGARLAGHTHVPCVLRDVPDYDSANVKSDGSTFPPAAFDTAALPPAGMPTLGHFSQGRAHSIAIRAVSRALTVSWAEHATQDE